MEPESTQRRLRAFVVIILIVVCWAATGASAQEHSWYRQFTADRKISVEFPGKTLARPQGDQQSYLVMGHAGTELFLFDLQVYPLPTTMDASDPKRLLEHLLAGETDKKFAHRTLKKVDGVDAIDASGVNDKGQDTRLQILLKDGKVIFVTFTGPSGLLEEPMVKRFFSSLHVKQ